MLVNATKRMIIFGVLLLFSIVLLLFVSPTFINSNVIKLGGNSGVIIHGSVSQSQRSVIAGHDVITTSGQNQISSEETKEPGGFDWLGLLVGIASVIIGVPGMIISIVALAKKK